MDRGIIQTIPESDCEVQMASEPVVLALSRRYAERGVAKAVKTDAAEQIAAEERTRELAPDAYRLSQFSESAIAAIYRRGKSSMSTPDLLRYFNETRAMRVSGADFSLSCENFEENGEREKALVLHKTRSSVGSALSTTIKNVPGCLVGTCRKGFPLWFDARRADTSRNTRRFPLSAFAAVAAVAASLMLIVSGSVMVTQAENRVSSLGVRLDEMTAEVLDMQSSFDVQTDLLGIRSVAVNEYGMVAEEFVKTDYVALRQEDSVEVFGEDREGSIGLGALLSAIGIELGN